MQKHATDAALPQCSYSISTAWRQKVPDYNEEAYDCQVEDELEVAVKVGALFEMCVLLEACAVEPVRVCNAGGVLRSNARLQNSRDANGARISLPLWKGGQRDRQTNNNNNSADYDKENTSFSTSGVSESLAGLTTYVVAAQL